MKLAFILVAILVAHVSAVPKCTPVAPGDKQLKQSKIQKLIDHINRPFLPETTTSKITVKSKLFGTLDKHEVFSLFDIRQWKEVTAVLKYMMSAKTFDEFLETCESIRHQVNEDLFLFAFITAIVHRPDTQGISPPRVQDVYPDKFFTHNVITKIKEAVNRGEKNIVVNDTHDYWNLMDVNHRLSCFTEDLGVNSHHYHWHTVHPAIWTPDLGGIKDRQGDIFFWMHRQMVSRYDSARLSFNLPRVTPFENWDDKISDGYASHLTIDSTGYHYMFRPDRMILQNLPEFSKTDLRLYQGRILDSIHKGYVYSENRTRIPIPPDPEGIDLIGKIVESTVESVNFNYYGALHHAAHVIAGRIADPDGKYKLDNGVMYDVATSARDPLFYKWHKYIDNIFQEYKDTLPVYKEFRDTSIISKYYKDTKPTEITWSEVEIEKVTLEGVKTKTPNTLTTFWDTDSFKIGKYFTFTGHSTAEIKVKHIQHEDFTYHFDVVNNAGKPKEAMFSVFLAPVYDEWGKPFGPNEHRQLLVELDKFHIELKPGKNVITRASTDSAVTVLDKAVFAPAETLDEVDQCRCGWPNYLLLPRGKPEGMKFKLIVYADNWEEDKAHDDHSCMCQGSPAYCRFFLNKVPDSHPLGFPFDRKIQIRKWEDIKVQNLYTTTVTITFTGDDLLH